MKGFGDRLRQARESEGVSLREIAASTRIRERYLQALERGDLESLPGSVFARGYIKAYAEFLGIDPEPLLQAYETEERERGRGTPEEERRKLEELRRVVDARGGSRRRDANRGTRLVLVFAAGSAVIGLALGVTSWLLRSPSLEPEPAVEEPAATITRSVSAPEPRAEEPETPEPSETPEGSEESPTSELRIPQSGVGTGIVDRNLAGRNDRFSEGEKVWFWTRVVGGKSGDRIRHVWQHNGRSYMDAELRIGASHWRTYSTFVLEPGLTGKWTVEARAPSGEVLAKEEFVCVSPEEGT